MEQGRTSHGVSVRGGTTCLIAVVCHTGTLPWRSCTMQLLQLAPLVGPS